MTTPKETHDIEQAIAGQRMLAAGIGAFYNELIAQGLPGDHAAILTLEQIKSLYQRRPDAE